MMKNIFAYIIDNYSNSPDKTAIKHNGNKITYSELYDVLLKRISFFNFQGVKSQDIVAIYMDNSIDMIVSILALTALKVVVLPLDVNLPLKRIQNILDNSNPKFILCDNESALNLKNNANTIKATELDMKICGETDFYCREYDTDDIIYCIYTSGSTGLPKGILLTARGIFNHIYSKIELLNITSDSILCLSFNISFVASIWQILAPFIIGSTLVIYDNDALKDTVGFMEKIKSDDVNILSVVPQFLKAYCNLVADKKNRKVNFFDLKYVILTGEKFNAELVRNFYQEYPCITLINAYGQSECSDDTFHYIIPHNFDGKKVPIGKPIKNINFFILDEFGEKTVDKGELYIGGSALSKGYLNDSCKTNQAFVYKNISKDILFKTGDIVECNAEGELLYLGRADNQVKIHGFRVELEDIENHICDFLGISEALVRTHELKNGDTILEALYTSKCTINSDLLKKYLRMHLPEYMLPSKYTHVENFDYLPNGKINREANVKLVKPNTELNKKSISNLLSNVQSRAIAIIFDYIDEMILPSMDILDTNLTSVGVDSITFISIVLSLEKEFGFEWDDDMLSISAFSSTMSILEYVESKVSK